MIAPSRTTVSTTVGDRMAPTVPLAIPAKNLNGHGSLFVRLADRWRCQVTTARARYERGVRDMQDAIEESVRMGDTERAGQLLTVFEVAASCPADAADPLYTACRADAEEELFELEHRRTHSKHTARRWYEALGKEARANIPAMAELRKDFEL